MNLQISGDSRSQIDVSALREALLASARYRGYRYLRELGHGGMGAVFLLRHPHLEELRAVKVMPLAHDSETASETQQRVLREARVTRKSKHPNIVDVYDFSILDSGVAIIEMEHVEGDSIVELLKKHPDGLPLQLTLDLACQVTEALAYLHGKGLVHRDISPDNLLVRFADDHSPRLKIIDLGVALQSSQTAHAICGKPQYSAPEVWSGDAAYRSDLYSLGVVLYEMLTGLRPFPDGEIHEVIAAHSYLPPRSFAETDRGGKVPQTVRSIVEKALSKDVEMRPESAAELGKQLAAARNDTRAKPADGMNLSPEETRTEHRERLRRREEHARRKRRKRREGLLDAAIRQARVRNKRQTARRLRDHASGGKFDGGKNNR